MPRKIRELRSELRRAGFVWRPAKGSHGLWEHPDHPDISVTLSGNDGQDAKRYQERNVRDALETLRKRQELGDERSI